MERNVTNYTEYRYPIHWELNALFEEMQEYATQKRIKMWFNFNDHIIYSDMTLDEAYLCVMGMTRVEYLEEKQKMEYERELALAKAKYEALTKVPSWQAFGKTFLPKEKIQDWNTLCIIRAKDLYHGEELENAIDIIRHFLDGNIAAGQKAFEAANHSGMSASIVKQIIYHFAPQFAEIKFY